MSRAELGFSLLESLFYSFFFFFVYSIDEVDPATDADSLNEIRCGFDEQQTGQAQISFADLVYSVLV